MRQLNSAHVLGADRRLKPVLGRAPQAVLNVALVGVGLERGRKACVLGQGRVVGVRLPALLLQVVRLRVVLRLPHHPPVL